MKEMSAAPPVPPPADAEGSEQSEEARIADAKKRAGNDAFALKKYDEAIRHYSEAIELDPSNHVFYSNRSACLVAKGDHEKAVEDATKCVSLNPAFVKGYYRLGVALMENGQHAEALAAVKKGLTQDPKNPDLEKQLRIIKARKRASSGGGGGGAGGQGGVDKQTLSEYQELQTKFVQTKRDIAQVEAQLQASQRDQKRASLTVAEVKQAGEEAGLYRTVGKMFLKATKEEVLGYLAKESQESATRETKMKGKQTYLNNMLQSQSSNLQEVVRTLQAQQAQ